MSVDDLRAFYRMPTDETLAKRLRVSKSTVSFWRAHGIPLPRQALIQLHTRGKLRADVALSPQ